MKRRHCQPAYADGRPRADGTLVHITTPIRDGAGRVVGHTCPCGRALTTASGGESRPSRYQGLHVVENRSHRLRVDRARIARKLARKAGR